MITEKQRQRNSEAGKAGVVARKEAMGEQAFKAHMRRIGKLGGRPTFWQQLEVFKNMNHGGWYTLAGNPRNTK